MANPRDPMDIKQIITLHKQGVGNREITRLTSHSRTTITKYISLIKACDYDLDTLLKKSAKELQELFPTTTTIKNSRYDLHDLI